MMNTKKLNSLAPDLQRILIEEGHKLEDIGTQALIKVAVKDEETMQGNGVKIVQLGPSVAPKLNEMYNDGILQTAGRTTPDDVKALWELAKSKNMLNQ